ncbi:MAG: hypothetical protein HQ582_27130 [Planctomycetes bacterium]|nr:hypothetical protein [Planctomycetota bacterium]
MRLWLRLLIILLVLAAVGVGTWYYLNRGELTSQWASHRVGAAPTFEEAQVEIAWFESGSDHKAKLRELVGKWGTGNQQFDLYLARHVSSPDSTEALRRLFSLGFGWHEERLPRWAHYWSWQTPEEPDREIASILGYLDLLHTADASKTITWREVLDLQAIFCLGGEPRLAKRLSPENWRGRYGDWRKRCGGRFPHVARPSGPFSDAPRTIAQTPPDTTQR